MEAAKIVLISIFAAVVYGIIHDQITARICVEYFTIGHPRILNTSDPMLLGLTWGVVATWWVGAILGVGLAIAARSGSRPKFAANMLIQPIVCLMLVTGVGAVVLGATGYLAATFDWVQLNAPLATRIPHDKHVVFVTDLWAHGASYFFGTVGGGLLMYRVWRSRRVETRMC